MDSRTDTGQDSCDHIVQDIAQEEGEDLEGIDPADEQTYTKLRNDMPGNICKESFEQFPGEEDWTAPKDQIGDDGAAGVVGSTGPLPLASSGAA